MTNLLETVLDHQMDTTAVVSALEHFRRDLAKQHLKFKDFCESQTQTHNE